MSQVWVISSDSRPKFQGDSESEEGILKFQPSDSIWQNHWWMLKRGFDDLLRYHSLVGTRIWTHNFHIWPVAHDTANMIWDLEEEVR